MKSLHSRMIACLLICAVGVTCGACGNSTKKEESSLTPEEASSLYSDMKQDMKFTILDNSTGSAMSATDATESGNASSNGGQTATSYVVVTDAAGEPVTDANGETVTEAVVVESGSNGGNSSSGNTSNGGNSGNASNSGNSNGSDGNSSNGGNSSTNGGSSYTPSMKTFQGYWMDMSLGEDYVFNGDFIDITFRVKDDAPDGNYEVSGGSCDFANYAAKSVKADFIPACITVGDATPESTGSAQSGTFTISGDSVQAKQGDEVTVRFSISDNPGLVALIFQARFDSNALEYVSAVVGDDCSDIISLETN